MRVVMIDIGLGNLRSVHKALETAGRSRHVHVIRSADPDVVRGADAVVMPGQNVFGAFLGGMGQALREALGERLRAGMPYLGFCLGLQALFETSDESPGTVGLGWFKGRVQKLHGSAEIKIPHMGWNTLELQHGGHPLLASAGGSGTYVYFCHSYHVVPADAEIVKATVTHGDNVVTAAVARDNVFASQFHPEKSQGAGLSLLERFLAI